MMYYTIKTFPLGQKVTVVEWCLLVEVCPPYLNRRVNENIFMQKKLFLQIPNFFHLTPIAVERHCAALKCE